MNDVVIHYVNAPAGAGKTHSLINHLHNRSVGMAKVFVAQPTIGLVDDTFGKLIHVSHAVRGKPTESSLLDPSELKTVKVGKAEYRKVHGRALEDGDKNAFSRLLKSIKATNARFGHSALRQEGLHSSIVMTTHASFLNTCFIGQDVWNYSNAFVDDDGETKVDHSQDMNSKHTWDLVIDETFNISREFQFALTGEAQLLCQAFVPKDSVDENYYLLALKGPGKSVGALKKLKRERKYVHGDDHVNNQIDFACYAISGQVDMYIKKADWEKAADDPVFNGSVSIFSVMRPDVVAGFNSCTIMSACFTDSLLYNVWLKQGVSFVPHERITDGLAEQRTWYPDITEETGLRYKEHENGHLLTVQYLTEAQASKAFYSKTFNAASSEINYQAIVRNIEAAFDGEAYIYNANNMTQLGGTDLTKPSSDGAVLISGSPHGLDSYSHHTKGAFFIAANPTPAQAAFFRRILKLSDDEQKVMLGYQNVYQSMARTALRDPSNTEPVTVIVVSKGCAEYLQALFKGSKVERIGDFPVVEKSRTGRPTIAAKPSPAERTRMSREKKKRLEALEVLKNTDCQVSVADDFKSGIWQTVDVRPNQFEMFADWVKDCADITQQTKDEGQVISPACFVGSMGLKRADVQHAGMLIVDVDDNDMAPGEFAGVLDGITMVVANTWSGNGKYRAFIPLSQPVTSDVYIYINRQILGLVESAGFVGAQALDGRKHGIDVSKQGPESKFYVPCKPVTGVTEDTFVLEFAGKPLDPVQFVAKPKYKMREFAHEYAPKADSQDQTVSVIDAQKTKSLIDKYKAVPSGQGLRHAAFFKLAVALHKSGLDAATVEQHLIAADSDSSRDIAGVMKSLSSDRY